MCANGWRSWIVHKDSILAIINSNIKLKYIRFICQHLGSFIVEKILNYIVTHSEPDSQNIRKSKL